MPQEGDADSGDDESDSDHAADLATLEELEISEEQRQEAIDRVAFDRCELVREAGERYRDGDSIPVIAAETGEPMMGVEELVETYYLVFANPPKAGVSVRGFRNGRRYFEDGDDVAELDAETRTEGEKQVRAFVGRTLLDNDPDVVDIEEPVPEMPTLWMEDLALREDLGIKELKQLDENLPGFRWPSAGLSLHRDMMEQARKNIQGAGGLMRRGIMRDFQNVSEELTRNTIPELGRAMQPSYSTLAAGSVFASSAAVSSVAAASMGGGLESAVFQTLNQPEVQEALQALRTMPWNELTKSLDEQLRLAGEVVEQMEGLYSEMTGTGAMMAGVARAGPDATGFSPVRPEQVIQELKDVQSPVRSEPVAGPEVTPSETEKDLQSPWWLWNHLEEAPKELVSDWADVILHSGSYVVVLWATGQLESLPVFLLYPACKAGLNVYRWR